MSSLTLASYITLLRIVLIPVISYFHAHGQFIVCLPLFAVALSTDYFDGKVARAMNQISPLGSLLDPVADKILVMSMFLILFREGALPLSYVVLVYVRNISQLLSIPILKGWLKINFKVKPTWPAKAATAISFFVIFFYLCFKVMGNDLFLNLNTWVMIPVSAVLELWVLVTYVPRFVQIARGTHDTFE